MVMVPESSMPPKGFRWVEPPPPQRRARRYWWIGAAVVVMLAVVAVGVVVVLCRNAPSHGAEAPAGSPPIGTPQDLLVSFPLNRQPVPGWQVSGADIGLPPGVKVGDLFSRNGTKAYFIALEGCDKSCLNPTGWVYGLETTTGARLFPPLALPGFFGTNSDCHSNGPAVAVCTSRTEGQEAHLPPPGAWVIDLDHGALTYHGPNTLNPSIIGGSLQLEAVGYKYGPSYLLAARPGEGLHGIGAHAELTWFLPGSGEIQDPGAWNPDIPPLTLAVQPVKSPSDKRGDQVFSVVDGKDLTPTAPSGTRLEEAVVYNGGFAYQVDAGTATGTRMYDATGREVGRQAPERSYPQQNAAMLTLVVGGNFQIYDAAGKLVTTIPSRGLAANFMTIGAKVYIRTAGSGDGTESAWQQWDLQTAAPGATCTMALGPDYAASDGTVVVTNSHSGDGSHYVAIDTKNCESRWEITGKTWIHKVGTGLIQVDHDRDMVFSLREPPK
ncbi:hypothetical protein BHQ23_15340 [Mycobacterium gordonae]|uniref:Uncharacterized protein n=2 Tax=Mycobacterium gordonae TaxID=1778 RepID=A0A1X1VC15_MYCGO|nr:hypothetical protein BHQ23_15340 [Mycobacterium gordonae]ORV66574.1 hypothetical protein AWC08_09555 [Mycobacterium gordonae]